MDNGEGTSVPMVGSCRAPTLCCAIWSSTPTTARSSSSARVQVLKINFFRPPGSVTFFWRFRPPRPPGGSGFCWCFRAGGSGFATLFHNPKKRKKRPQGRVDCAQDPHRIRTSHLCRLANRSQPLALFACMPAWEAQVPFMINRFCSLTTFNCLLPSRAGGWLWCG